MNSYAIRILGAAAATVAAALALTAPAVSGTSSRALEQQLAQALAVPHVSQARTAAVALDLQTGRVVFSRRAGLSLAPASTEKLAVSYALLVELGPSYRIYTRVYGEGEQASAVWRGDLVLKGYGDPTLSSAGLRLLAQRVRAQGIRRVTGAVVGDESFFDARRTAPGWRSSYYLEESPPLSALVADRARYRGKLSRNPALAAAAAFRAALAAAGVQVAQPSRVGVAASEELELAALASPPLAHVVRAVNRQSDNFAAEQLLKHFGAVVAGEGTTPAGAAAVTGVLRELGIPLAGVRIVDGSGLSLQDRLTADALVAILAAAWEDPVLRGSVLSSLAIAGRNGTLKRRLVGTAAAGQVFAKTGTTRQASTLAGYVGGRYAFAVLQNGEPVSSHWSRVAQDRFVTVLARQQR